MLAGVDEAGRGSVLGPLVVAGVSMEESKLKKLVEIGVKDSKLLTPKMRNKLNREIRKLADHISISKIAPGTIDEFVMNGTRLFRLNYLEARHMAIVLSRLKFDRAYVDCCDTDQERFGNLIWDLLQDRVKSRTLKQTRRDSTPSKIKSEHFADRTHIVVSAASIVAKVERDTCIKRLHRAHGPFGTGYPSDPKTVQFLRGFFLRSEKLPEFTRVSWKTVGRLNQEFNQPPTIDDFAKC